MAVAGAILTGRGSLWGLPFRYSHCWPSYGVRVGSDRHVRGESGETGPDAWKAFVSPFARLAGIAISGGFPEHGSNDRLVLHYRRHSLVDGMFETFSNVRSEIVQEMCSDMLIMFLGISVETPMQSDNPCCQIIDIM